MSKCIKRSGSILMVLALLFSFCTMNVLAAEAEDEYGIMPCWTTINKVTTNFTISGINSTSVVVLYAQENTSLKITVNLQKKKSGTYQTIETWTETGNGTRLTLQESRLINAFADYRIKVICKAGSETSTIYDYP